MSIGHRARVDIQDLRDRVAALERRVVMATETPPPAESGENCATCGYAFNDDVIRTQGDEIATLRAQLAGAERWITGWRVQAEAVAAERDAALAREKGLRDALERLDVRCQLETQGARSSLSNEAVFAQVVRDHIRAALAPEAKP